MRGGQHGTRALRGPGQVSHVRRGAVVRQRVLMVMTHCDMGGAEMVALQLIEGLAPDFAFTLFAVLDDNPGGAVRAAIEARCAAAGCAIVHGTRRGFKRGGVIEAAWRLARTIRKTRPGLVHLHCEIAELTYAVALVLDPRLRRQRVLRTVHNSVLWIDWHAIGRWVTRRLAHAEVIAVSRAAAAADAAILGGACAAPAIVYNGVVPPPSRLAREPGPFRLLFAGRFAEQKGCDLLPAIFAAAARTVPDRAVVATIAGQGVLAGPLQAASWPQGWQVTCVPPIADLAQQLRAFDGVIMPSRHEGLGLLAVEALLAGVPLVATRVPGLDEVLPPDWPLTATADDVAALGHQLARLIAEPERFAALARDARPAIAARFSVAAMLDAHAARYRGGNR
jgi:glycosyltransferase involved in cell wall biosynthesis